MDINCKDIRIAKNGAIACNFRCTENHYICCSVCKNPSCPAGTDCSEGRLLRGFSKKEVKRLLIFRKLSGRDGGI
jgi:hypothetical protein